jgi:hypothetical protein
MSGLPVGVFLPFLAFAFVAFMFYQRRVVAARQDQQYASYRAGELANRLGLQIVEGDPSFNLFISRANAEIARGPRDGRPVRVRVRLKGSRDGAPIELVYDFRWERETGVTKTTWRKWFDCRIVVEPREAFPEFEVRSRQAQPAPIAAIRALPPVSTGIPAIDQAYAVATKEPRLAVLLGQHLSGFDVLGAAGVHLVGEGRTISFVMREDKAPLLASVLFHAEQVANGLVRVARAVGG